MEFSKYEKDKWDLFYRVKCYNGGNDNNICEFRTDNRMTAVEYTYGDSVVVQGNNFLTTFLKASYLYFSSHVCKYLL